MTMSALMVVRLAERVVGLTASERFKAVQKLDSSGGSFLTSKWFTLAMVLLLVAAVAAFAVVTYLRKAREKQAASAARPASPRPAAAQNGRKAATPVGSVSKKTDAPPQEKPAASAPPQTAAVNHALIAMFPFTKKIDSSGPAQPAIAGQLPRFFPAKVIGVIDRAVSVETTLSANVGDRVLVVIESQIAGARELIEDTGVVRQSAQPATTIDAHNAKRLAVEMAGLNEAQLAQIAGAPKVQQPNQAKG